MSKLSQSIEESGLKRFYICQKVEISKSTLQRWERGENLESVKNFLKLAKLLDIDINKLLE